MTDLLQNLMTAGIVATAIGYLAWRFARLVRRGPGCACRSCGRAEGERERLVQLDRDYPARK